LDNKRSIDELGMKYIDYKQSIIEMAYDLIKKKKIEDKVLDFSEK